MIRTIWALSIALISIGCGSTEAKERTLQNNQNELSPLADEMLSHDVQNETIGGTVQDTLPSGVVELLFASRFYQKENQPFLKNGGLSIHVLPSQGDSLIYFQLVNNSRPDRMQPISNLRYSPNSNLIYVYDVFSDSLIILSE